MVYQVRFLCWLSTLVVCVPGGSSSGVWSLSGSVFSLGLGLESPHLTRCLGLEFESFISNWCLCFRV